MNGGSPEPTTEPFHDGSIPPYEYPVSPIVDVAPEQLNEPVEQSPGIRKPKRKPERVQPFQRPHKPFITHVSPVTPVVPEKHPVAVVMSHPETVTLPPTQEVEHYQKPVVEQPKDLTPVKQKEPEKLAPKIDVSPQKNNFSGTSKETKPLIFSGPKPAKRMHFKGRVGRQRTNEKVIELLTLVQARGVWPNEVSDQMRRYYKREYPEYFRKMRKRGKVQTARSSPIDIQARRSGTDN